jgi:TRAP-type C4-dicarboxylate transport system substrate-binding protein
MTARRAAVLLCLALVCAASGCSAHRSNADKAGGRREKPVVLTLATTSMSLTDAPPVRDFARRLAVLSDGALRIKVVGEWGSSAPNSELQVVRGVAAGRTDLGWVGSRAFDVLGVHGFRALSAPMLIDSYDVEAAVMSSDLPARMLESLRPLHVVGIGVLGDTLRRAIGVRRPLVSPAAWRGITFGTYPSKTQEQGIRALGAHPFHAFGIYRVHALQTGQIQGFEFDVDRYAWYDLAPTAPYVAANVVLWPQVDVVFGNPERMASLTSEERSWLRQAAQIAARRSVQRASEDAADVRDACATGARFVEASPENVAALRVSFNGVYRDLERDPQTRAFIRRITDLKRSSAAQLQGGSPHRMGCRR